eukprot:CAMPEP_0182492726 /NCGR_PEP_ID=MMETSP1321-20130603/1806_1 /TAXON_ID=91990 /ORGANISM="Bolidomonas sp., Strain RCC1657" /LENGTH=59 /DNA_ID=CAMNT_0024695287 /DNA_START=613 /DNA_END=792 /DNA_ORIENTATION=+
MTLFALRVVRLMITRSLLRKLSMKVTLMPITNVEIAACGCIRAGQEVWDYEDEGSRYIL